jgi:hypothetical protein
MNYTDRPMNGTPNPWLFETRLRTFRGIQLHATRGGSTVVTEGPATEGWMKNPNNGSASQGWGASCDVIIFHDGTRVWVNSDVPNKAPTYGAGYGGAGSWSAGWYYLQVEIAQANPGDYYLGAEVDSMAELTAEWARRYGFAIERIPWLHQDGPPPMGICTHQESDNGQKLGKTDPGAMWPWDTYLRLTNGYLTEEDDLNEEQTRAIVRDEYAKLHTPQHREWETGDVAGMRGLAVGTYVRMTSWGDQGVYKVESGSNIKGRLDRWIRLVSYEEWAALPDPKPDIVDVSPHVLSLLRGRA